MAGTYSFLELFETIQPGLRTIAARRGHPVFNAKTGESKMSSITFDRRAYETNATVEFQSERHLKSRRKCGREEEFRFALDSYLEDYRMHNAMIAGGHPITHSGRFKFFKSFTGWRSG
jgi:hypothetical protein